MQYIGNKPQSILSKQHIFHQRKYSILKQLQNSKATNFNGTIGNESINFNGTIGN